MSNEKETIENQQGHAPLAGVMCWVAFKDRKPPDQSKILATGGKDVYSAKYDRWNGVFADGQWQPNATHWMPLPKPPCT